MKQFASPLAVERPAGPKVPPGQRANCHCGPSKSPGCCVPATVFLWGNEEHLKMPFGSPLSRE